jgi:hypothetical protein
MNGYLLAGFVLGVVLIVVYVGTTVKEGKPRLETAAGLLLSAVGVCTGGKVIKICVVAHSLAPFADEDRVYIALGGVALIWVSCQTIWNSLFRTATGSAGS